MSLIGPLQRHHERLTPWPQRQCLYEPESAEARENAPELMEDDEGEEEGSSSESEGERRGGGRRAEASMATKPHRQLCRSPCLDRPSFSQSSTLQELRLDETAAPSSSSSSSSSLAPPTSFGGHTPADRDYQTKMEFALKLGYSGEQVEAVLSKLGPSALTNDVLAELVRLGNKGEIEAQAQTTGGLASAGQTLAPRGYGAKEAVSPEASLEEETTDTNDNLRPIVIDGSNVAMRYIDTKCH